MQEQRLATESEIFPVCGARARMIRRFERDLSDWCASPQGRFAVWRAQRAIDGKDPLPCDLPARLDRD